MPQSVAYKELEKKVKRAHRRYSLQSVYTALIQSIFYVSLLAAMVAAILTITPGEITRWPMAAGILTLIIPLTFYFYTRLRISIDKTSVLIDKHLHLKEKISSALELGRIRNEDELDSPWYEALLNDAVRESHRLDLKRAFPWNNPRELRWLWAPMTALILTGFVIPHWDLFHSTKQAQAEMVSEEQIKKELDNLFKRQLTLEKRSKENQLDEAAKMAKELKDLQIDFSKGRIEKREALAQLSSLEKEWEKRREAMKKTQPQMNRASSMNRKMTGDMAEALEENDYEKASQKLEELQKQLKMESLDDQSQEALSEELNQLAQNLTEDSPLTKGLLDAAKQLSEGDTAEALKSLELAQADLDDLQEILEQMKMMDAALSDLKFSKNMLAGNIKNATGACSICQGKGCASCNGTGKGGTQGQGGWKEGETEPSSGGMGGAGIGRGGQAPFSDTEVDFDNTQLRNQMGDGPLLGALPVDGESNKNESMMEVRQAYQEYRQEAEQALTKEKIPVSYQYQVQAYFNTLKPEDMLPNDSSNEGE